MVTGGPAELGGLSPYDGVKQPGVFHAGWNRVHDIGGQG